MRCNISIIYNVKNKLPVGVVCVNPISGDIAYSTNDNELLEVLEVLLDNKLFLLKTEDIKGGSFIVEEAVTLTDSYYVMALNYALPLPWWIMDTYEDSGDVEDLSNLYFEKICKGSDKDGKIEE